MKYFLNFDPLWYIFQSLYYKWSSHGFESLLIIYNFNINWLGNANFRDAKSKIIDIGFQSQNLSALTDYFKKFQNYFLGRLYSSWKLEYIYLDSIKKLRNFKWFNQPLENHPYQHLRPIPSKYYHMVLNNSTFLRLATPREWRLIHFQEENNRRMHSVADLLWISALSQQDNHSNNHNNVLW